MLLMSLSACASDEWANVLTPPTPQGATALDVMSRSDRHQRPPRGGPRALITGPPVECENEVHGHHHTDVVISDEHRFVFVDNVKAASTTVRVLLKSQLNISWKHGCERRYAGCCSQLNRTTSACLARRHAKYFTFGFARHPAIKFESGVRQAWFQRPPWQNFSADQLLAMQLNSTHYLNEHLQPTSYRFAGLTSLGKPMHIDYIGHTERAAEDMRRISAMHCATLGDKYRRSHATMRCPLEGLVTAIGEAGANSREADPRSRLSFWGLHIFCNSELYRRDSEVYGYECMKRDEALVAERRQSSFLKEEEV